MRQRATSRILIRIAALPFRALPNLLILTVVKVGCGTRSLDSMVD
jgi:hypothetical protein